MQEMVITKSMEKLSKVQRELSRMERAIETSGINPNRREIMQSDIRDMQNELTQVEQMLCPERLESIINPNQFRRVFEKLPA